MSHYYSEQPDTPSQERNLSFSFNGQNYAFVADRGVFSKDHIDEGSRLLLVTWHEWLQSLKTEDLDRFRQLTQGACLDLGCGYGFLGILGKRLWPSQTWVMTDVNERALDLTRKNLELNGIYGSKVVKSQGFAELSGPFDLIVSNPPIRIGKAALYDIFRNMAANLRPGGACLLVIGKKQGAESAGRFLSTLFGQVEVLTKDRGFFIYLCQDSVPELALAQAESAAEKERED